MLQKVHVQVIASADTYKRLFSHLMLETNPTNAVSSERPMAHVLLDFPTTWSFERLEDMNSVERARTVVVVQGRNGAFSDIVASYHVSGVVTALDEGELVSSIYAAAASMRTYVWKSGLTYMELRVSRLLLRGFDTQSAATQLRVSTKTINAHVSNAIGKLGYDSRAQFIAALLAQNQA